MAPAVDGHFAIIAGISLSFVAVKALKRFIKKRQNNAPLPPGPVSLPLLGSVLSIDAYEPWLTYTEWGAVYGTWTDSIEHTWYESLHQGTWSSCEV